MPVHSVLITNVEGMLLFAKYFDQSVYLTADGHKLFERSLYSHTMEYKKRAAETQCVTISCVANSFYVVNSNCYLVRKVDCDVHVVFRMIGDLLIYCCGTDDIDELICKRI